MEKLKFYNMKLKKAEYSANWKTVTKKVNGRPRKFAVAKSAKSGTAMWRALPKK